MIKLIWQKALVTGGGSGIGKMIAAGFAHNGAKVYIAARKESQLKEVYIQSSYCHTPLDFMAPGMKAANEINETASGKVHYIVANIGVRASIFDPPGLDIHETTYS
jgi:NADP-dependent 3-hydroxy acid dehydrogenase YdfG